MRKSSNSFFLGRYDHVWGRWDERNAVRLQVDGSFLWIFFVRSVNDWEFYDLLSCLLLDSRKTIQ